MHKYFRWSGLFLFILTLCVCGCSGSGSSADPMGTGTVQFVAEYNAPFGTGTTGTTIVVAAAQVQPSNSLTLTAWVSNFTSEGKLVPVINERVTFTLDSPENGGRLAVLNDRTASNGQARVVYTAGNNLFPDVVRVTTSIGATASITITKTGTTTRGPIVSLLPLSPASAAPLGFVIITATVTDNGLAVQGERVTFTLTTNNGASLSVPSGVTNAGGQVTTIYQAGNNNVQDVVQASLSNGTSARVVITKTGVGPGRSIVLAFADPTITSVAPGRYAIITATVRDSGTNLVSGALVRFSMTTSNGSISRNELTTNGSGVASMVYHAGNNLEQDILQATTDGAFTQFIITKTGTVLGYTATMVADPTTMDDGFINDAKLTVTVVNNNNLPVQGLRVRFNAPSAGGTITPSHAMTGIDGKVIVTYTIDLTTPLNEQIVVDAYVDINDNSVQDQTDPTAAAVIDVKS
ncbi:MAG: hypothetical protein Q8K00_08650 [Syntrophales bacterium]|nr:hypothetical protein [Syntrophales bacterium]